MSSGGSNSRSNHNVLAAAGAYSNVRMSTQFMAPALPAEETTRISAASGYLHLKPEEREKVLANCVDENERLRYEYDEVVEESWFPQEPLYDAEADWAKKSMMMNSGQQQSSGNNNNTIGGNSFFRGFEAGGSMIGGGATSKRFESAVGANITVRASQRHPTNLIASYQLRFDTWQHFYVTLAQRNFYIHVPTTISTAIVAMLFYTFLSLTMGDSVSPGGELFDPFVTVVFSGVVGGSLSLLLSLPPLVGILWAAIFWANIADRTLVRGITSRVTSPIKMLGLTMILLKGGLSINLNLLKPMKWNALLLATVPLTFDVVGNFFVTQALFGYENPSWALLHASTLAPISASVVVTSVLYVQSHGRGSFGGPLLLLLSCVPFDSALGVFLATFMQRMVLEKSSPVAAAYLAPGQIIGGVVGGVVAGVLVNVITDAFEVNRFMGGEEESPVLATAEQRLKFERSAHKKAFWLILAVACTCMMIAKHFELEGAGSLFVVALGATLAYYWNDDPQKIARKRLVGKNAETVWNLFAMPALFSFVGASVHLDQVFDSTFFFKGVALFVSSFACRLLGSSIASATTDFSRKERFILSVGFVGKASAQATLALMVYDKAQEKLAALTPHTPEYEQWVRYAKYGQYISNSSVIMILAAAPMASIILRVLGKKWVRPDVPE
jgi:NhaP-type Na+/H+ or K+/H+ antiporter